MDPLSLQEAAASIETARTLTRLFNIEITPVAILPVKVDRRYQITTTILRSLEEIAKRNRIPILPVIRTDAVPTKASRSKKFLAHFDPACRAMDDYNVAFNALADLVQRELGISEGQHVQALNQFKADDLINYDELLEFRPCLDWFRSSPRYLMQTRVYQL